MSTEKNKLRQRIEINLGEGKKFGLLAGGNQQFCGKGKKKVVVIAEDSIKEKKYPDKKKK